MTTKEQERTALAKIRKIVEGLGEDSYVGTALEGCFEIAERNIEYDWASSYQQLYEDAVKAGDKLLRDSKCKDDEIKSLEKQIDSLQRTVSDLEERYNEQKKQANEFAQMYIDERKGLKVECTDGFKDTKPVKKIEFFNHNGFRFINVTEPSGWTNSFKIDDLVKFELA